MVFYNNSDELRHYGIKGMKWGVRRYQNYDGSYTKAGVKRYNNAMDIYDKRMSDYKKAKADGVKGDALRLKKAKVKEQKREVEKHYKHLKLDKKADQGKILYAEGKRITANNKVTHALGKIGTLSLAAASYNYATKTIPNERVTRALAAIGTVASTASIVKYAADQGPNNKLRAYYSHTSNY
jgi:hypothetical protein